jgi:2-polyprenyl-6-methoxyphenol hydroxylase-like FAD-dependent oxidoreductase
MQDAGALADALVTHSEDLPAALLAYQTLRAPATAKIQMLSRKPVPALASAEPRANVR